MQSGRRSDGTAVMIGRDRDVVSLRECGKLADLRDAVAGKVGAEHVDQVLAEQILKRGRGSQRAAEAERSDAFAGKFANGGQACNLAGFVQPQRVQVLEGVAQAGGVARGESRGAIHYEIRSEEHTSE